MKKLSLLFLATTLIVTAGCRQPKLNVTDDGGGIMGTYGMSADGIKALGESADPLMKNKVVYMAAKKVFTDKVPLTTEELTFLELVIAGERGRSRSIVAQILAASARLGGNITPGTSQGTSVSAESIPGFRRWTDGQWYFDVDVNHVRPVPRGQAKLIAYEEAGIGPEHPDWANTSKKAYLDEVYRLGGAPLPTAAAKTDTTKQKNK